MNLKFHLFIVVAFGVVSMLSSLLALAFDRSTSLFVILGCRKGIYEAITFRAKKLLFDLISNKKPYEFAK